MASPLPVPQYLVAFSNGPLDDPALITSVATPAGTLGGNNVWTDITPWVLDHQYTRGRQHELQQFQAGTLTVDLINTDGRFNAWNASGPYFGLLLPKKLVQYRATWDSVTYYRFTGHATVWAPIWGDSVSQMAQLQASDALRLFNALDLTGTQYQTQVLADTPAGYWQLGEQPGNTIAVDSSGNNHPGSYTSLTAGDGAPTLGAAGLLAANIATSMSSAAVGVGSGNGYMYATTTTTTLENTANWSVEAWMSTTNTTANDQTLFDLFGSTSSKEISILVDDGALAVVDVTGGSRALDGPYGSVADGLPHHIVLTNVGSTGTWVLYRDGAQVGTGTWAGSFTDAAFVAFGGQADASFGLFPLWQGSIAQCATYAYTLTPTQVTNHYAIGTAGFILTTSGAQINATLNVIGWSPGARAIDTGNSMIQANTQNLTTTAALSYQQAIEETEAGAFFMSGAGEATFLERDTLITGTPYATSQLTIGDEPSAAEIGFQPSPTIQLDDLDIYNQAVIQRQGGVTQSANDLTSQGEYGVSTWTPNNTLLMTSDVEAQSRCQWVTSHYAQPVTRVAAVSMELAELVNDTTLVPNAVAELLGIEMLNRVTLNRHSNGFTQVALVEQISETVSADSWLLSFALAPADTKSYWVLGDSVQGVLGSTTGLAY